MTVAPWRMGTGEVDARWCAEVYAASWPHGARGSYSGAEIDERLATRPLRYWEQLLVRSTVCLAGTQDGARGFALVTPEGGRDELSYLFVEPAAFGSGLAGALHDEAVRLAGGDLWGWVLEDNTRSLAFLAGRGWQAADGDEQPWWAGGHRYVLVRLEAADGPGRAGSRTGSTAGG